MSKLLSFLFIWCLHNIGVTGQHRYGMIYSEVTGNPKNFSQHCITYSAPANGSVKLPEDVEKAVKYKLLDLLPSFLCKEDELKNDVAKKVVAVNRGNCTFSEKAYTVQDHNGTAILVVNFEDNVITPSIEDNVTIIVAIIKEKAFKEIKALGDDVSVQMYASPEPRIGYNMVLIWAIATFTVAAGGYWSGTIKHKKAMQRLGAGASAGGGEHTDKDEEDEEPETLDITPVTIFVFVVLMCAMLVSLYFLYKYLVYLVIAMFTFASTLSMYACLKPIMLKICGGRASCRCVKVPLPCKRGDCQIEVRRLFLALVCMATTITWAVFRNHPLAWILQDLLGIMFCMNMMKTLRLPSLQACTILLALLFVYDIFFVFITPLFTKNGESIMVQVASGGSGGGGEGSAQEKLPMVMLVPKFGCDENCMNCPSMSMLGFGDILVPGLLISYCYGFDLTVASGKIYYIAVCIGYGLGMIVTFVALALMDSGQPALLYLVPFTLIPTFLIALKRKEFKRIWHGKYPEKAKYESGADDNDEEEGGHVAVSNEGINRRNTSNSNVVTEVEDTESTTSSTGSQAMLINR